MCDDRIWQPLQLALDELEEKSIQLNFLAISRDNDIDSIADNILAQLPSEPSILLGFSLGDIWQHI